ncbi:MAG: arsenate reductase ArsC [Spirochaetales bacterium]|nr:arsenate reductase ArsC [Spirochaetales bacterium]
MKTMRVLFVCIHNSARSQMAEAFLRELGGDGFQVFSAGLEPGKLNPVVVEAMAEVGIDISGAKVNLVTEYLHDPLGFDYVVTVCDAANGERCPLFPGRTKRLHWGFEDPSSFSGEAGDKLAKTRVVRDQIKAQVEEFLRELRG